MGSLILLFILTLFVILLASYREIRQKNTEMLERFADLYFLGQQPEEPPEQGHSLEKPPIDDRPDYRLSTFYSVAIADDGTVLASDNGEKDVYSEEELTQTAQGLLEGKKQSGRSGHLSYLVRNKGGYTLVAFLDNTVSESSMNTLLHNFLITGGAAVIVLFFLSLFLSKRIIRPLEENDTQQKQFISDAGHELKTPVAVIGANAELLSREIGKNEWLENIRYENERMGGLVKQLLDLSRAENREDQMEKVDLSRTVTGEALAFESFAFERGKVIQSDIEEGVMITGSRAQLAELTSILLDNAIRHSTGNEIWISLKSHGHAAVLDVINEGNEIPPEKLEHVFDRFYRIDESRNSEGQHYGLGLSIAKAVAQKHHGSISASCKDGRIRFEVSFPVK